MPGTAPPRKSRPMLTPVMLPIRTKGMLGGMMGPIVAEEAMTAAAISGGYFAFFIAGMRIVPVAAASATEEPDIPAMIMLTTTETLASPPVMCPTRARANLTRRSVTPPFSINSPASMKRGTARSGKESSPYMKFWGMIESGIGDGPSQE